MVDQRVVDAWGTDKGAVDQRVVDAWGQDNPDVRTTAEQLDDAADATSRSAGEWVSDSFLKLAEGTTQLVGTVPQIVARARDNPTSALHLPVAAARGAQALADAAGFEGASSVIESGRNAVNAAVGPGGALGQSFDSAIQSIQDGYSDADKASGAQATQRITDAEGFMGTAAALGETLIENPDFVLGELVKQVPNLFGAAGAAKAAKLAGAGTKAATAVASAFMAKVHGASVGADTYREILAQDPEQLRENLRLKELMAGGASFEEASSQVANELAILTDQIATATSFGMQYIPGFNILEKGLAGGLSKGAKAPLTRSLATGVKGGVAEGIEEFVEEGGGKVLTNAAVGAINSDQPTFEGAADTGAMALLPGAGVGGVVGARSGYLGAKQDARIEALMAADTAAQGSADTAAQGLADTAAQGLAERAAQGLAERAASTSIDEPANSTTPRRAQPETLASELPTGQGRFDSSQQGELGGMETRTPTHDYVQQELLDDVPMQDDSLTPSPREQDALDLDSAGFLAELDKSAQIDFDSLLGDPVRVLDDDLSPTDTPTTLERAAEPTKAHMDAIAAEDMEMGEALAAQNEINPDYPLSSAELLQRDSDDGVASEQMELDVTQEQVTGQSEIDLVPPIVLAQTSFKFSEPERERDGTPADRANPNQIQLPSSPTVTRPIDRTAEASTPPDDVAKDRRRKGNAKRRRRIATMAPDQIESELYRNDHTGLLNRRAFVEDETEATQVVSIDVDALASVNDYVSPQTGDEMLKQVGKALTDEFGDSAYHVSGDEFYVLDGGTDVNSRLSRVKAILHNQELQGTKNGKRVKIAGMGLSIGVAENRVSADEAMKVNKVQRERDGYRPARKSLPSNIRYFDDKGREHTARLKGSELVFEGLKRKQGNETKSRQGEGGINGEGGNGEQARGTQPVREGDNANGRQRQDATAPGRKQEAQQARGNPSSNVPKGTQPSESDGRIERGSEGLQRSPGVTEDGIGSLRDSVARDEASGVLSHPTLREQTLKAVEKEVRKLTKRSNGTVIGHNTLKTLTKADREWLIEVVEGGGEPIAFVSNGKIHVLNFRVRSPDEVRWIVAHEAMHLGVQKQYASPSEAYRVFQDIADSVGGDGAIERLAKSLGVPIEMYRKTYADREFPTALLIEELAAFMAHTEVRNASTPFKKLMLSIRTMLNRYGISLPRRKGEPLERAVYRLMRSAQRALARAPNPYVQYGGERASVRLLITPERSEPRPTPKKSTKAQFYGTREGLTEHLAEAKRRLADKFEVIARLQTFTIEHGGIVNDDTDTYRAEQRSSGMIADDLDVVDRKFTQELVRRLRRGKLSQEKLDKFLIARHATERNREMRRKYGNDTTENPAGMSDAEAAKILFEFRNSGEFAALEDASQIVYTMTREMIKREKAAGLIDDHLAAELNDNYEFYVPLKGFAVDPVTGKPPVKQTQVGRSGSRFSIGGKEGRFATGRHSEAASPSTMALTDLTTKIVRAHYNEVGQHFLRFAEANPNSDIYEIFTEDRPDTTLTRSDDKLDSSKKNLKYHKVAMVNAGDKYFRTKRDGKVYYIKIHDAILDRALRNMRQENIGPVIEVGLRFNRFLSRTHTAWNPEFAPINFFRDAQVAILKILAEQDRSDGQLNGEAIVGRMLKSVPDAAIAMRSVIREEKTMQSANLTPMEISALEMIQSGGLTGFVNMQSFEQTQKDLARAIKRKDNRWTRSADVAGRGLKMINDYNSVVENTMRLAAFHVATLSKEEGGAGLSKKMAANIAKDVTVNFNMRGENTTTMGAFYMFANASVQGSRNMLRALGGSRIDENGVKRRTRTQKAAAAMYVGSIAWSMVGRAMMGTDDDGEDRWDKVSRFHKERALVIPTGWLTGDANDYFPFPLPYGYNVIKVAGEMSEASLISDYFSAGQMGGMLLGTAANSFSPIGFDSDGTVAGTVAKTLAPTIGVPFIESIMNMNFFGGTIHAEEMPFQSPTPASGQGRTNTPEAYKRVAKAINSVTGGTDAIIGGADPYPETLEHIVNSLTGGAGNFITNKVVGRAMDWAANEEMPDWTTLPFVSRLAGSVKHYDDIRRFYERRDYIDQLINEQANAEESNDADRIKQVEDEYGAFIGLQSEVESTQLELAALRKERTDINNDASITQPTRHRELQRLDEAVKIEVDYFNKLYNEARN